jgi:sec-independent protein translocase protein TatC
MKRTQPNTEMPFLDHLEELRVRLFWIVGAVIVGLAIGLFLTQRFNVVDLLLFPAKEYLTDTNGKLVNQNPADGFTIVFSLAFWVGVVLASPVILFQLWRFVSPALYPNERRVGIYVLAGGLVLFCMGASLAFFYVLPASLKFFQLFGGESFTNMYTARGYFSMLVTMLLTFGVAFELPIVIVAFTALGLVTPTFLRTYRRHALVLCVVGAAAITPGDFIAATIAMVVPLYFLYELGIFLSHRVHRWRERRENAIGDASEAQGAT